MPPTGPAIAPALPRLTVSKDRQSPPVLIGHRPSHCLDASRARRSELRRRCLSELGRASAPARMFLAAALEKQDGAYGENPNAASTAGNDVLFASAPSQRCASQAISARLALDGAKIMALVRRTMENIPGLKLRIDRVKIDATTDVGASTVPAAPSHSAANWPLLSHTQRLRFVKIAARCSSRPRAAFDLAFAAACPEATLPQLARRAAPARSVEPTGTTAHADSPALIPPARAKAVCAVPGEKRSGNPRRCQPLVRVKNDLTSAFRFLMMATSWCTLQADLVAG